MKNSLSDDRPILIIDALNVFIRHFIANPTMSALGHHAGGVVGFLKCIQLLANQLVPSKIIVAWEGGGSPRRRAIFKGYKSNRRPQKLNRFYANDIPDTIENKHYQISLLIALLKKTPVLQLYISDCEADDIIAYLTKYVYKNSKCVIASSDRDYYQLLSTKVMQWSPGQKKYITPEDVLSKFNISVENFCTARAIIGDPSDNIEGIKGAGFKTLAKRFPELQGADFVSTNKIIKLSEEYRAIHKLKIFERIATNADIIKRNWRLMYLDSNGISATQIQKINRQIDTFEPQRNKIGLMKLLVNEGISTFDADSFCMSLNSVFRG